MTDRKPSEAPPPDEPKIPEPPPFDPDLRLIGDMERSEKSASEGR
jgi:hypothetical protein